MLYAWELETFLEVADAGSFAKGAERRGCSSVSAMNQVNAVERQVGVALFERTNRGVVLTEAGRSLCRDAREIMRLSDEAEARAREIAGREQVAIRVGTSLLRPAKPLIDALSPAMSGGGHVRITIVPFGDDPAGMRRMLDSLGREIDCFVSPCDSATWRRRFGIVRLGTYRCCVALAKSHRLAGKERLVWDDLDGETLMLVRRGESRVLDALRDDVERNHPLVAIRDMADFYDTAAFNECARSGRLMETLEPWRDIHPAVVTLPMEWDYAVPYGVVHARQPSAAVARFVETLRSVAGG